MVDRVELKVSSAATRGGQLDLNRLATVDLDHLRDLVAQVKAVRDDVPIGVFLMAGCGDHPRVKAMRSMLGDSLMGQLVGEPEQVAETIRSLEAEGIERVQITPYTPDTLALLAPFLAAP